jgi:hypothetical protein
VRQIWKSWVYEPSRIDERRVEVQRLTARMMYVRDYA